MKKKSIHKMAKEDAYNFIFPGEVDIEKLGPGDRAMHGTITNPLITPFMFATIYITLIIMYSFEKLKGNLKEEYYDKERASIIPGDR